MITWRDRSVTAQKRMIPMKRKVVALNLKPKTLRSGVAAVEFAVVFPVVILFTIGLLELSAGYRINAGLKTAMIRMLREASISTARHDDIEDRIVTNLAVNGIAAPEVKVSPGMIFAETASIEISIMSPHRGGRLFLRQILQPGNGTIRHPSSSLKNAEACGSLQVSAAVSRE